MGVHTMTAAVCKHAQGLLTSLILSSVIALCTSTPIPPQEPLHPSRHYERLVRDTNVLFQQHQNVYTSFKTVRHNDANIIVTDFTIAGVPSVHELPQPDERLKMEENQLLPQHYRRLRAFERAFGQALEDEYRLEMTGDSDFYNRMREVLVLLQRVVSKLRQTMVRLDIDHEDDARPNIAFSSVTNQAILNMRILYVMQELNENLLPTLQDFDNFKSRHDQSS